MISKRPILQAGLILIACSIADAARAQSFTPVTYELRAGSVLIDDCLCERPLIELPLRGTMVLTRLPVRIVGELYSVTEIDLATVPLDPAGGPAYAVKGKGTYYRNGGEPGKVSMDLEVEINGAGGIHLASGSVGEERAFPGIAVTAGESAEPPRDPVHIFRLRIVAAPRTQDVLYELVVGDPLNFQGSIFIDDCTICGRPTIPVPVAGTFRLARVAGDDANPFTTYAVTELAIRSVRSEFDYQISGIGTYVWGGEVALLQTMDLTVAVNDDAGVLLASGLVPFTPGTAFPEIGIDLAHQNPKSPVHVYSLHLVVRPAAVQPARFRRGDSNADGGTDISDAVHILLWRFAGGETPSCLEAADVDADGDHAITDAVVLLAYLFLSAPPPPAPGPTVCGPAEQPIFGCADHPPCA